MAANSVRLSGVTAMRGTVPGRLRRMRASLPGSGGYRCDALRAAGDVQRPAVGGDDRRVARRAFPGRAPSSRANPGLMYVSGTLPYRKCRTWTVTVVTAVATRAATPSKARSSHQRRVRLPVTGRASGPRE